MHSYIQTFVWLIALTNMVLCTGKPENFSRKIFILRYFQVVDGSACFGQRMHPSAMNWHLRFIYMGVCIPCATSVLRFCFLNILSWASDGCIWPAFVTISFAGKVWSYRGIWQEAMMVFDIYCQAGHQTCVNMQSRMPCSLVYNCFGCFL